MPVAETTATAVVAFAATNIDDIVVLSVLFARRDEHFQRRHIVAGQYLGFAVLVAVSLAASAGLLALHDEAAAATTMTTTAVASITVANGADNIAIYAPLFATFGTGGITATLLVFFALIALWCLAGLLIGSRPAVIRIVESAGNYAIPVVLIGLGIFILAESGLVTALLEL